MNYCVALPHPARRITGFNLVHLLSRLSLSLFLALLAGCQSPKLTALTSQESTPYSSIVLREGDVVRITFSGAPNLNTVQQIRRDGKIYLTMVGDLKAVGMAPADLEKEVLKLYESQLVSKQVTVTLESSQFPVFVTGAVLRPGKIGVDRPLTALEAIMEAGGFDYSRANTKSVRVIRQEEGQVKTYTLNLKPALNGQKIEPFYLKPSDILYVPEKFSLF